MDVTRDSQRVSPGWWTLIFVTTVGMVFWLVGKAFSGSLQSYVPVTLTADRAGLVMEPNAKVKLRGVQVGRVNDIRGDGRTASIRLELYPDKVKYIPINTRARIAVTTVFGAKYVELIPPSDPSPHQIVADTVLRSDNVTAEVNTLFQNLIGVIDRVDPAKLNGVLAAVAEGIRGKGDRIGEATTAANRVLAAVNERGDQIGQNWQSLAQFSDVYEGAAEHILNILSAASTTSTTLTAHADDLDRLLLTTVGLARSGINVFAPSKDDFVTGINALEPTIGLLNKYDPALTCTLVGAKMVQDEYGQAEYMGGRNGYSLIVDAALLLGDDPYRYPENLPIHGAKGGPGGKPGCGSLPDVSKNWPVRHLVTNSGFGQGIDLRPNPGIGFPGWANFFPVTKAVPEPPRIRYPGPPAPGPDGQAPVRAEPPPADSLYGPEGEPLYPGLPPADGPPESQDPGPSDNP